MHIQLMVTGQKSWQHNSQFRPCSAGIEAVHFGSFYFDVCQIEWTNCSDKNIALLYAQIVPDGLDRKYTFILPLSRRNANIF